MDSRVVLLTGPRQAGKTTLARMFATDQGTYFTLDDQTTLAAARADPVAFIRNLDRAIIDEIQRAPELLLAIKRSVDEDPRPGRFLLTGSANLLTLPQVADSLAGRMSIVDLLPLSVAEIEGRQNDFLHQAFAGHIAPSAHPLVGEDLIAAAVRGGYPEAVKRATWLQRRDWCRDYIRAIVERDVRDVAQIEHLRLMPMLLKLLSHHSGQLVNYSQLGAPIGLNHVTTQKYATILEQLFLTRVLHPWSTNELKRLIKTPKLHFLDSGILAATRNLSPQRISSNRNLLGPVLESFVFSEVLKIASWTGLHLQMSHYRDKEQNEVDLVIENDDGQIIGLEVKSSASVKASDFNGLRKLASASGSRFAIGLVLYDETTVIPFGSKLYAAPISSLWG